MANRLGGVLAVMMSAFARAAGPVIFYLLRWIYRPNERAIALTVLATIFAMTVLIVAVLR